MTQARYGFEARRSASEAQGRIRGMGPGNKTKMRQLGPPPSTPPTSLSQVLGLPPKQEMLCVESGPKPQRGAYAVVKLNNAG